MGTACTVCAASMVEEVAAFGLQPPANRFIAEDLIEKQQEMFPLGLGFCSCCQTIQLSQRMPMDAVAPRYPWLVYNEPELHLDDVTKTLRELPGIGVSSRTLGVTYKDKSTLDRLARLGLSPGVCLSFEDFNIFRTPVTIDADIKEKYGQVDLLIARHIVEHAVDAVGLILQLKDLLLPGGYLVIELPDSLKVLQTGNHAFIWEEHISYFTEQSLPILADKVGAKLVWSFRYPYHYEDSLVAVLQFDATPASSTVVTNWDVRQLLQQFNRGFAMKKLEWRQRLQKYRDQGEKVAVFGAGHLAVKWINFLSVSDLIDCVIDDYPHKMGMHMPGSKLPIVPSSALQDRNIKICISTLSPESEEKVRVKLCKYFDEGGLFISAFKKWNGVA